MDTSSPSRDLVLDSKGSRAQSAIWNRLFALESLLGAEIMDETDTSRDMRVLAIERSRAKLAAMGLEPVTPEPDSEEDDEPTPPAAE